MCGILAALKSNCSLSPSDVRTLDSIRDKMISRGPDSSGSYIANNVYLGHRRLSIQDLTSIGAQPAFSPCGKYSFVFNGEIYNHLELRNLLSTADNNSIKDSSSDTLTLSYLLSYFSLEYLLPKLSGMFALVVYDHANNLIHVCRDKFGEKPCFFAQKYINGTKFLIFTSLLSSLKELSFSIDDLNYSAVYHYLATQSTPALSTIFKSVSKVPPATLLTFSTSSLSCIKSYCFWNPFDDIYAAELGAMTNCRENPIPRDDLIFRADSIFKSSISKSLSSDVPISILLSGGIDSSLIAYYSSSSHDVNFPLSCFTLVGESDIHDESSIAINTARSLGLQCTGIAPSIDDVLRHAQNLSVVFDEPFSNPSALGNLLLCEAASSVSKVVLTGDGGDELFSGYYRYWFPKRFSSSFNIPHLDPQIILIILNCLEKYNVERFISTLFKVPPSLFQKIRKSLSFYGKSSIYDIYSSLMNRGIANSEFDYSHILEAQTYFTSNKLSISSLVRGMDLCNYLASDSLVKSDRSSMFFSIESRSPFLESDIVDFALSLDEKTLFGTNYQSQISAKYLLKALINEKIPGYPLSLAKRGFTVPIKSWMNSALSDWCRSALSNIFVLFPQLAEDVRITSTINKFLSNQPCNTDLVWSLVNLYYWGFSFFSCSD